MRTDHALLALALCACAGDKDATTPADPVEITDIQTVVGSPIGTVVTVTFETSADATAVVEFGEGEAFDRTTRETASGTEHSVMLVGLPQDRDISLRVVAEGATSDTAVVTTGSFPSTPPAITVVEGANDRFIALPLLLADRTIAVVIDPDGRIVWAHDVDSDLAVYRVHVLQDGTGIAYTATLESGRAHEGSEVVRVSWDGSSIETTPVPWLAHDFVELPSGTLVSLAADERQGTEGSKLVSIDPDGTQADLWSTWDCFDPVTHPSNDPAQGWTHANALDYDEANDMFLVGLRNLGTIVGVDAASGACEWAFGGSGGDVEVDGQAFVHQHQFTRTDGGLMVFDNDGAPGNESRVLEYSFDEAAGTATLDRTLKADPPIYSFILGDVHRLANDDTMIVWSVAGTIDRMDASDNRTWRAEVEDGVLFGFSEPLMDPGRPELGGLQ